MYKKKGYTSTRFSHGNAHESPGIVSSDGERDGQKWIDTVRSEWIVRHWAEMDRQGGVRSDGERDGQR